MTTKQRRFAEEYLVDCNATQAAIRAGYAENSAGRNADALMKNHEIRAYIDEQLAQMHDDTIADADEVMRYLSSVMRGKETEQVLKLDGDGKQKVVDVDVSAKDRIRAGELIGKRYGIFRDGVNVSGAVPVVIAGEEDIAD